MKSNKKFKYIIATIFSVFILGALSSCSGSKYTDGQICGEATVDGTNAFSEIRRYYCEEYVHDLYKAEVYAEGVDEIDYLYMSKFIYDENAGKIKLRYSYEEDSLIDKLSIYGSDRAHYLFYYYDEGNGDATYSKVIDYLDKYDEEHDSISSEDMTNFLAKIKKYSIEPDNKSYFRKINNMSLDGDSATDKNGANITSVERRMQSHSKACMVFQDEFTDAETGIIISKTTWGMAWKSGLIAGLLVYPMAWFINVFVTWFGVESGIGQVFAIIIVTIILKGLIFLATFKSQNSTHRMQEIQPELSKLQAKYGASPTAEEKQRMSMEMMALYRKYNIKPLAPFISLLVTFPVFIAMYRAVMYLGVLRKGRLLGVVLGDTVSSYMFGVNANWAGASWTALVIFLLMAASQVLTMKLPQILNSKKMTPEAKKTQTQTGMITNVMMIMILFMGFMMPITMSIYWIASALVSLAQNLIMHNLNNGSNKKGKFKLKRDDKVIDIPQGYKTK